MFWFNWRTAEQEWNREYNQKQAYGTNPSAKKRTNPMNSSNNHIPFPTALPAEVFKGPNTDRISNHENIQLWTNTMRGEPIETWMFFVVGVVSNNPHSYYIQAQLMCSEREKTCFHIKKWFWGLSRIFQKKKSKKTPCSQYRRV